MFSGYPNGKANKKNYCASLTTSGFKKKDERRNEKKTPKKRWRIPNFYDVTWLIF